MKQSLLKKSLVFKCLADSNGSEHKYPRPNGYGGASADDPYYDTTVPIISATDTTVTVNVGISSNTTQHTFVRSENAFTPTGANFVPGTGVLTVTLPSHPFVNGDKVQIKNESFTFTCAEDGGASNHAYPRVSDPASQNAWLTVSNVSGNNFDINVGTSSNTTTHTWVSCLDGAVIRGVVRGGGEYNHTFSGSVGEGLERKNSTITVDVGETVAGNHTHRFASATSGAITAGGNYTHTFASAKHNSLHHQSGKITLNVNVAASNNQYDHQFVSAVPGAVISGGSYNHTFVSADEGGIEKANDYVYIEDYALGFSCDLDHHETTHLYPRPTDHASNEWLAVSNVTTDKFDIQVLSGVPSTFIGSHTVM